MSQDESEDPDQIDELSPCEIIKFTYVQHRKRRSMSISLVVLRFEVANDLPLPQGLDYCGLYNLSLTLRVL